MAPLSPSDMSARVIGIDTNIIVRVLTRDDETQYQAAVKLIKAARDNGPLFVNPLVVTEAVWVLESVYETDRQVARTQLAGLLDTVGIAVPATLAIGEWTRWMQSMHRDMADIVIAETNRESGCTFTYTFDKKAAKTVPGMELLA